MTLDSFSSGIWLITFSDWIHLGEEFLQALHPGITGL